MPLLLALACSSSPKGGGHDPFPTDGVPPPVPTTPTGPVGDTAPTGDTGGGGRQGPECGELRSVAQIGAVEWDELDALAAVADGALYAGGSFIGTLLLGTGGPAEATFVADYQDGLVLRYEADGSLGWARQISSPYNGRPNVLAAAPDGGVVAAGGLFETSTFAVGQADAVVRTSLHGGSDSYVARFHADGRLAWVAQLGVGPGVGPGISVGGVAVLADGSVLVAGWYHGGDAIVGVGDPGEAVLPRASQAHDAFVARLDADGRVVWAEAIGGADYAVAYAAALDPVTGELVVVGLLRGPGVVTFPGAPANAVDLAGASPDLGFVARWDVGGGARSVVTYEGGPPQDVEVAPDGGVLVAGAVDTGAPGTALLARFAPDGTLDWTARAETNGDAYSLGVAAAPDGGALVTGDFTRRVTFGAGEPSETSFSAQGSNDSYGALYDASGALRCAIQVGGSGFAAGWDAVLRPDGTYTTTGYFSETAAVGAGTAGETLLDSAGVTDGVIATWAF